MNRRIAPCSLAAALLATALLPAAAGAFRIGAHEQLTARACDLEAAELPELARFKGVLMSGNAGEDQNVIVKWLRFNHYYSPIGKLATWWRKTSDVRVKDLWVQALEAARRNDLRYAFDRVGHLLHHVQDMASPPHVVPVTHGFTDGFEAYDIGRLIAKATGAALPDLSGPDAHHALALDTYRAVQSDGLRVGARTIPWTAFWKERRGQFGAYGEMGNAFGRPYLLENGRHFAVDRRGFADFIRARVEAAIGYSRAFLRWAVRELKGLSRLALTKRPPK